jgi:hypothetical protein
MQPCVQKFVFAEKVFEYREIRAILQL